VGPLGKSGGPSVGKGGEWDVENRHLQGCSPRLCHLRTDGLAVVSKYWTYWSHAGDMCPINRCSLLPIDDWLFPTASISVVEEKLGTDPRISQSACCGLGWEPFFLGAVDPFNSIDDFVKGCHLLGLPTGSVQVAYMDWRGKRTCHVYQISHVWCTSIRIVTTLKFE
jgi:hypothetical protein